MIEPSTQSGSTTNNFCIMSLNSSFSGFHHHLMMATAWIATVVADEGRSGGGTAGTEHIRRKRIPVKVRVKVRSGS